MSRSGFTTDPAKDSRHPACFQKTSCVVLYCPVLWCEWLDQVVGLELRWGFRTRSTSVTMLDLKGRLARLSFSTGISSGQSYI